LKVTVDQRHDHDPWWGSPVLPDGGVTMTLTEGERGSPSL
jgi:hypothetical protein